MTTDLTLEAVKKAIAVVLMDEYARDDEEAIQNLAEAALRAASLPTANIYTTAELERVLTDLDKARNAALGHRGHLDHIGATDDAKEAADHVVMSLNLCATIIGTLRHAMVRHEPDVSMTNMTVLASELLPLHMREAMLQFTNATEMLQAEGPEDLMTLDDLMGLGMVSKVLAGGYAFMQLRPLGVAVRAVMQGPDFTG